MIPGWLRAVLAEYRSGLRFDLALGAILLVAFSIWWFIVEARPLSLGFPVGLVAVVVALSPASHLRWTAGPAVSRLGCRRRIAVWLLAIGWAVAVLIAMGAVIEALEPD
ncbi:MAG: hypothetical protein H0U52_03025 [Chloroflexi bacterium]|nr:hypothetical protein [Chloroflexota bacterium]